MFIEPTITWVPSGFTGYIWLDTKIVLKKIIVLYKYMLLIPYSMFLNFCFSAFEIGNLSFH